MSRPIFTQAIIDAHQIKNGFKRGDHAQEKKCGCANCNPNAWWMVVCELCGNKRCPHGENHLNECTKSNALDQIIKYPARPSTVQFSKEPIKKRVRQDSKPLMNKLETEFYQTIRWDNDICDLNIQAVRFRLGNGIWYKPDFTAYHSKTDRQTAWEVKGPHIFRGGIENLKVAAGLRKDMDWILAWKENGVWQTQRINP